MITRSISGLVVATGTGAPMRSARPKPIHLLCGRAMASYVLDTLASVGIRQGVVVTGVEGGRVSKRLLEDPPGFPLRFVEQKLDRGTGDAVLIGLSGFDDFNDEEDLLIVPADLPLLRPDVLEQLLTTHAGSGAACTVLAVREEMPGFGRVIRNRHGAVSAVVAEADLDPLLHDLDGQPEYASGVYCVRRGLLAPAIRRTRPENAAGELLLSDVVEVIADSGHSCAAVVVDTVDDLVPVDDRLQLAWAEAELRRRTNRHWLAMGVTMVDPERTYIDATVSLGTDVTIFPGTILQGSTTIGDGCELGPDVRLDRCQVGLGVRIEKATARLAVIGDDCTVGPFAVLHPGSELPAHTTTGPFYAGTHTE
ncbi:MAG: NTP transferase domain-containing protein [Acidimicrobiales bacterium]